MVMMKCIVTRLLFPFMLAVAPTCTAAVMLEAPEATGGQAPRDDGGLMPNVPPGFNPTAEGLSSKPLIIENLGFAMYAPAGSVSLPQRIDGQYVLSIMHQGDPPRWSMSVQHLIATTSGSTPASEIDLHLAALRKAERPHRILTDETRSFGGSTGQLCFIEQTGPRGDVLVSGWLVLPVGDNLYLIFSLVADSDEFTTLEPLIERSFATLNLRTAEEVAARRLSTIEAARDFLASLTPERLKSLDGIERWSRIYLPNSDGEGETEIGYSLLQVRAAKRGELNPNRAETAYSAAEQQEGLLVRLQGRIIGDLERNIFLDSLSLYWLSWDMTAEAWDVKGTQRQGQAEHTQAETGVRTAPSAGDPRPLLTVIRDNSTTNLQSKDEWAVPDVYLSQALSSVLGRLLPRDQPRDFAWYFYNFSRSTPQLTRRIDRWAPAESAGGANGSWELRTQLSIDSPVIRSTYSPSGELVRTVRHDGVVTEPIELEELVRLWDRKGLPIARPRTNRGTRR